MVIDTVSAQETYRFLRRLALALALLVCADFLTTSVQAQLPIGAEASSEQTTGGDSDVADSPPEIETNDALAVDVQVASLPTNIRGGRIPRFLAEKATDPRDAITPPPAPQQKNGMSFGPVELRSIPESAPTAHLPSDTEVLPNEITRLALAAVFAGGMIDDDAHTYPALPNPELQDAEPANSIPNRIPGYKRLPAPNATLMLPALPIELGMIEDDNVSIQLAPGLSNSAELIVDLWEDPPIAIPLQNYSLPGGGLDIYQLAPTRFHRQLPSTLGAKP